MELAKQPETELEYWLAIESLGGFAWRMNHDLADSRIQDPTGGIDREIVEAGEITTQLVVELGQKFGVIAPKDCPKVALGQTLPPAPEGKIYYQDWYEKMKTEAWRQEYEGIICSACPFSEGAEGMRVQIPCSLWRGHGSLYNLEAPHSCGMLGKSGFDWTERKLFVEILQQHGVEALDKFRAKLAVLRAVKQKGEK